MTENTEMQAENERLKARVAELEESLDEAEIKTVAAKHIDLRHWDAAKRIFADFLTALHTTEELDALSSEAREGLVEFFFADYAKKNPSHVRVDPPNLAQVVALLKRRDELTQELEKIDATLVRGAQGAVDVPCLIA